MRLLKAIHKYRIEIVTLVGILALMLASFILAGCEAHTIRTVETDDGPAQIMLKGRTAETFKSIIGHTSITPSESVIIHGTDKPGPKLVCHEKAHAGDAKFLADLLVEHGFLRNEAASRWIAWIAIYLANHTGGYESNLLEERARQACADF